MSYQPGLSTLHLEEKLLQKGQCIFRHDLNQVHVQSQQELKIVWAARAERLEDMFMNAELFKYIQVIVSCYIKVAWET